MEKPKIRILKGTDAENRERASENNYHLSFCSLSGIQAFQVVVVTAARHGYWLQ
jgi:hypothetical protein